MRIVPGGRMAALKLLLETAERHHRMRLHGGGWAPASVTTDAVRKALGLGPSVYPEELTPAELDEVLSFMDEHLGRGGNAGSGE